MESRSEPVCRGAGCGSPARPVLWGAGRVTARSTRLELAGLGGTRPASGSPRLSWAGVAGLACALPAARQRRAGGLAGFAARGRCSSHPRTTTRRPRTTAHVRKRQLTRALCVSGPAPTEPGRGGEPRTGGGQAGPGRPSMPHDGDAVEVVVAGVRLAAPGRSAAGGASIEGRPRGEQPIGRAERISRLLYGALSS